MTEFRRIPALLKAAAPGWTLLASVLMLAEIAFGLGTLYLIKRLVDGVTLLLSDEGGGIEAVLWLIVLTGVTTVLFAIARSLAGYAREAQGLKVGDHVDQMIHARATEVDLAFYESPRYFDTLQRARQAGLQRPAQVVSNLLLLLKNLVLLGAVVVLIATVNLWILPILALAIIPALLVRLYFTREQYDWQKRRTQLERRAGYLDWLMTSDLHAKELRLNELGPHLMAGYKDLRGQIRTEKLRITGRRTLFELVVATGAAALFFGALGFLARETWLGRNTVGDLVLFLVIFQRAQGVGQEVVGQIGKLYEDNLYLGLLFRFLDVRSVIGAAALGPAPAAHADAPTGPLVGSRTRAQVPEPIRHGIRFEGVSFRYPGSDAWALSDVDLEIRPGQVVALVGANGSGKTSLIKLLCRLYDPTEGRLTIDGTDIRRFDLEAYRRIHSVIFQDYSRYADTVRENIRFGDLELPPNSPRVLDAARTVGADRWIEALPRGYDTRLTRLFDDGQELSVGQWQKIALARAFLRSSQVVILDEPTSALDPNAEYELFENFRERIGGRMALVISHRLSTVRLADMIYIMDDGRILESGSHDALMEARGMYWDLFSKQGKYFRLEGAGERWE